MMEIGSVVIGGLSVVFVSDERGVMVVEFVFVVVLFIVLVVVFI